MASRKPRRASGLSGQVAAVFIVALACLLVAVGLGVDASTAYSAKTGQEAVLEAVRQSSLGMANAVKRSSSCFPTTATPAPPRSGTQSCPNRNPAPATAMRAST